MAAAEQNPKLILHPGESTNHQCDVVHGVSFSETSVVQRNGSEIETGEGGSRRNRGVRVGRGYFLPLCSRENGDGGVKTGYCLNCVKHQPLAGICAP